MYGLQEVKRGGGFVELRVEFVVWTGEGRMRFGVLLIGGQGGVTELGVNRETLTVGSNICGTC